MGAQCTAPEACCRDRHGNARESISVSLKGGALLERGKRVVVHDGDVRDDYDLGFDSQHYISTPLVLYKNIRVVITKAKHKSTRQFRAIKQPREGVSDRQWWSNELDLLGKCDHPHISRLYEYYRGGANLSQVVEICPGKSLSMFSKAERGSLSEAAFGLLIRQALSAIAHVHSHGYCHLELTAEDFFLSRLFNSKFAPLQDLNLKLVNLGLARQIDDKVPEIMDKAKHLLYHTQGMSPEQVEAGKENLDTIRSDRCDVWAIGVITCFVLTGAYPVINQRGLRSEGLRVSLKGKHFIETCLKIEPKTRPSAAQVLDGSSWLADSQTAYSESLKSPGANCGQDKNVRVRRGSILGAPALASEQIVRAFRQMSKLNKIERAAITAAVHRLPEDRTAHIRLAFERLDTNGDGSLSVEELVRGLGEAAGLLGSVEEMARILQRVDTDGNKSIDYTEFVTATYSCRQDLRNEVCEAVFSIFDHDRSGTVTLTDIGKTLSSDADNGMTTRSTATTAFALHADCEDGIDLERFKKLLKGDTGADDNETPTKNPKRSPRSRSPRNQRASQQERAATEGAIARKPERAPSKTQRVLQKAVQFTSESSIGRFAAYVSTGSNDSTISRSARASRAVVSAASSAGRRIRRAFSRGRSKDWSGSKTKEGRDVEHDSGSAEPDAPSGGRKGQASSVRRACRSVLSKSRSFVTRDKGTPGSAEEQQSLRGGTSAKGRMQSRKRQ